MTPVTVGISLKTYFTHARATGWFADVAARAGSLPALTDGTVRLIVIPTYPQLPAALEAFAATPILVGSQDVSAFPPGAYTGEVTGEELAELGVAFAEIGHAERRRLFDETDEVTAAKASIVLRAGMQPLLCLGEHGRPGESDAAAAVVAQLHAGLVGAPAGPITVAYEPVWAIGAPEPAPVAHIAGVTTAVREALDALPERAGSAVIYGGSAGPGLLSELGGTVDGLFLGRFGHDVENLLAVIGEATELADRRAVGLEDRAPAPGVDA